MSKQQVPERGDIYSIDSETTGGREAKNSHRYVVVTRSEINRFGIAITVPVAKGTSISKTTGLTVALRGYDTIGVAVCNQLRCFNIEDKVKQGSATFIESLDDSTMREIINRVVSVIDPA